MTTLRDQLRQQFALTSVEAFVAKHSTATGVVVDLGAKDGRYRKHFPTAVGLDIQLFDSIDLNGDAHALPLRPGSVDTIVSTEMLEHCTSPSDVIGECHRALRSGGTLVLTTRFMFPVHDAPGDYYRFTPEGMRKLLERFENVSVEPSESPGRSVGVWIQRLAMQIEWRPKIFRLVLLSLARLAPALDRMVVQQYGDAGRISPADGVFSSGLLVIATKGKH